MSQTLLVDTLYEPYQKEYEYFADMVADNSEILNLIGWICGWKQNKEEILNMNMTREVMITAVSATNHDALVEELMDLEGTPLEGGALMCCALDNAFKKDVEKILREIEKKLTKRALEEARPAILQQGEKDALLRVVTCKLTKQLGSISKGLKKKVAKQNVEHLEKMLDVISDFHSEQEVFCYLAD